MCGHVDSGGIFNMLTSRILVGWVWPQIWRDVPKPFLDMENNPSCFMEPQQQPQHDTTATALRGGLVMGLFHANASQRV